MAIRVPSKNIYELNNKKVVDNVIERIEVRAVEVVPDNEYDTPVYNESTQITNSLLKDETTIKNSDVDGGYWEGSAGGVSAYRISASYVGYVKQKTIQLKVKIKKLLGKKLISNIKTKTDKNDEANIKYTLLGVEKSGTATANWSYTIPSTALSITEGQINYSSPTNISETTVLEFPKELSISENSDGAGQVSSSAKQSMKSWGNIKTATASTETIDGDEYYTLDLQIMGGVTTVKMTYYNFSNSTGSISPPTKIPFEGSYTTFEPTELQLTINGNTIGIDLQDKTVYIPSDNKTIKKVFSIEGNELMQTSNTVSLEEMYSNTQKAYANGKETATIRCSISKPVNKILESGVGYVEEVDNYYDPATDSEIRIITITLLEKTKKPVTVKWYIGDGSGGINTTVFEPNESIVIRAYNCFINEVSIVTQMAFDIYDQVIPMVYGADGQDRPMSVNKDGNPKVFQVLGTKIYYDGAVWQELYLQEA